MHHSTNVQGDTFGRGKAFVDIKVGSSDHQLSFWGATVTGGKDNETFNRTFSATTRVTLYFPSHAQSEAQGDTKGHVYTPPAKGMRGIRDLGKRPNIFAIAEFILTTSLGPQNFEIEMRISSN